MSRGYTVGPCEGDPLDRCFAGTKGCRYQIEVDISQTFQSVLSNEGCLHQIAAVEVFTDRGALKQCHSEYAHCEEHQSDDHFDKSEPCSFYPPVTLQFVSFRL